MWQPEKIIIKNLLTHENTEYNFSKNKSTLLYGKNLTDSGSDSNGSGKSGIIEGITLSLSGKTCRDVGREDFIRDNTDECYVQFDLINSVGSVNTLSIKRWIHRKKSAKIELYENGELNLEMTSVNEANQRIFDLIGISREDLLHFFVIGQSTNYSFLTSGDAEQKQIIARLTNANIVDEKITLLKDKCKIIEIDLQNKENEFNRLQGILESVEEDILDEKTNAKNNVKEKILEIEEVIEECKNEIEEIGVSRLNLKNEINETKENLSNLEDKIVDLTEIENKITTNRKKIRNFETEINEFEDLIEDLKRVQSGAITCPNCSHKWHTGKDIDINDIPNIIEETNSQIKETSNQLSELKKKNVKLTGKLDVNNNIEKECRVLKNKISDKENFYKNLNNRVRRLNDEIEIHKETINRINKQSIKDSRLTTLKEKKKSIQEQIIKIEQAKNGVEKDFIQHNFWINHLGKKGFTTYLANHSVKTIEGITNSYLQKFNTDLTINIDGYTVLKSGDVREKINISVIRNGRNSGTFNRYSGGEKGRIDIACIVGLQKLMNMSANNGGLNLLVLDEVFEGLDVTGQKDVLNILSYTGVTTLIVTHKSNSIGAENEIYVVKENGVSKLFLENGEKN